jgi:hypothetical protein
MVVDDRVEGKPLGINIFRGLLPLLSYSGIVPLYPASSIEFILLLYYAFL